MLFEQAKRKAREANILDVARRHGVLSRLKKIGDEYVGPCPNCGGTDRFAINPRKLGKNGKPGLFVCRRCGEGGDAIDLERFLSGTKFRGRSQGSERRPNRRGRPRRSGAAGAQVGVLPRGHRGDGVRPEAHPGLAGRDLSARRTLHRHQPPGDPAGAGDRRSRRLASVGLFLAERTPTSLSMSCTGGVSAASSE